MILYHITTHRKRFQMETYYKAINWNAIEDVIDKSPGKNWPSNSGWIRIPLSNDLDDWRKLSQGKRLGRQGLRWSDPAGYPPIWVWCRCPRKDVRTAHRLSSTTFNLWSPFTPSLLFYLFCANTKSEIDEIFGGPIQTHTCKRKLKSSMRYT